MNAPFIVIVAVTLTATGRTTPIPAPFGDNSRIKKITVLHFHRQP